MQSSYSLIKRNSVLANETKKTITTNFKISRDKEKEEEEEENVETSQVSYDEAKRIIEDYKEISKKITEKANKEKERILIEATVKAEEIEKEAYEKGYAQGISNGENDGKKEALDTFLPKAEREAEEIRKEAEEILMNAQGNYEKYLESKKEEIISLAINIAEQILNREVSRDDGIDNLVEEALKLSRGQENIIIRCNPLYEKELKEKIPVWKISYNIQGEIFIMIDKKIEKGNAIVEKQTGDRKSVV